MFVYSFVYVLLPPATAFSLVVLYTLSDDNKPTISHIPVGHADRSCCVSQQCIVLTTALVLCNLLTFSLNALLVLCMYLYVLGFSNHPSLLKVGVSKSPLDRIATLEKHHGKCVSSVFYNMGKTYQRAEKLIHVLLDESNVIVDGDGGTEFFDRDVVFDVVS